ncbi:helix-turn-helix domain-containing protein [Virgibacillus halodenitrificans]|uniref:helix-turn-helix domain-containing protein n=1 Tax=Virgibacillus halodenitrificans TaxID=1482 RepID=UPI000760C93D
MDKNDLLLCLGEQLVTYRRKTMLTQEEVAWRAGISARYLSDLERGNSDPSFSTLLTLLNVLEVSDDDFIKLRQLFDTPSR